MVYCLMRPLEFGTTGWGGQGAAMGFKEQYNFEQNITPVNIQTAETLHLHEIVGKEMYADMIVVRNSQNADYTDTNAIVKMFPNDTAYEDFWQKYGLGLCYHAMLIQIAKYEMVLTTNSGAVELMGQGYKRVDIPAQTKRQADLDNDMNTLRKAAEKYLCENKANFPKLRADICGLTNCCASTTTSQPINSLSNLGFHLI